MNMRTSVICAIVAMLLVVACSDDEGARTVDPATDVITVTGKVTYKDDRVPVDGGVIMELALDDGGTETLLFGSLYTDPPPSQEQWALYQVIVTVDLGDRVVASGRRNEYGLLLETLQVLSEE